MSDDESVFLSIEEDEPGLYVDGAYHDNVICIETAVNDSIEDLTTFMLSKYIDIFNNCIIALEKEVLDRD